MDGYKKPERIPTTGIQLWRGGAIDATLELTSDD